MKLIIAVISMEWDGPIINNPQWCEISIIIVPVVIFCKIPRNSRSSCESFIYDDFNTHHNNTLSSRYSICGSWSNYNVSRVQIILTDSSGGLQVCFNEGLWPGLPWRYFWSNFVTVTSICFILQLDPNRQAEYLDAKQDFVNKFYLTTIIGYGGILLYIIIAHNCWGKRSNTSFQIFLAVPTTFPE